MSLLSTRVCGVSLASPVPVIDIGPFIRGEPQAADVVRAIEFACRATGFFLVIGHGVPERIVTDLSERAREFFDMPADWKQAQGRGTAVLGGVAFAPLAQEALAATLGVATPGDYKESLNFGQRLPGDAWPERPPGLEQVFRDYFAAMETLARHLRAAFCAAIGLAPDYFEPSFRSHLSALRVINYPEQRAPPLPDQLRAGAHTDYGFMTILRSQASLGGLQVQARGGAWLDAPSVEDAFVVNIGDAFMRWTNNEWVSTPHRVVNPPGPGHRRQSIPFFLNPDRDTLIECLAPFRTEASPAKYAPITFGDYIELKTRQAFAAS